VLGQAIVVATEAEDEVAGLADVDAVPDVLEEEGEALEEVQRGGVDGVEEAAGHQGRQTLHTGNRGKQSTWNQKYICMSDLAFEHHTTVKYSTQRM